jgi:diguanylate cyclase (GGDEF)-like protein
MLLSSLRALFRWLTEPARGSPEKERLRGRLLAWLVLALLGMTGVALAVALAVNPAGSPLRGRYAGLILSLMVLLLAAFGLNRAGRYTAAAWLVIAGATAGPWGSAAIDRSILRGDYAPLIYTVMSVFLCSLLLSVGATVLVAVLQFTGLLLVPVLYPAADISNWPSLITLVLFMSVISVVASIIMRQDLAEIERQARLLEESEARLREQSVRDALTTLFNRRYLDETLGRELRRAERAGQPLGLMMLDIDHFKRFNDTHGHAAGDAVLHGLGVLLRGSLRASDIACRYGGEEFILLLPEATRAVAVERAEQIRASARRLSVPTDGRPAEVITLSVGVAAYPADGATSAALLKSADVALYRAKRAGRDRVAQAEDGSEEHP